MADATAWAWVLTTTLLVCQDMPMTNKRAPAEAGLARLLADTEQLVRAARAQRQSHACQECKVKVGTAAAEKAVRIPEAIEATG